ncbi:hypothetical protein K0M31_010110 [Melipona bicolor]|uniref:Uncharacterized protein n=1 Tax=Melipona bicolor TaxID=60889 RepID=A0AA40FM93_9HYME|nr:hypothetical protein K0M31_010110 [Melipona bicolor]
MAGSNFLTCSCHMSQSTEHRSSAASVNNVYYMGEHNTPPVRSRYTYIYENGAARFRYMHYERVKRNPGNIAGVRSAYLSQVQSCTARERDLYIGQRVRIDRGTEPIAGREHFQGFPRLVFQRFLSTRANRSDPFVRVGRRKLAFYEPVLGTPDPAGTMEGSVKFAGKKGGEQGNPLSGLRKA